LRSIQEIAAIAGILAPIVAFTCILLAVASYPNFSWTNNALSDLGIISGITGPLFNFSLCACGFLSLIFALAGLFFYFGKNWTGKLGTAVFAAASLSLIGIGIFNENFSPAHYLFSVAFFVLLPVSALIITGAFAVKRQSKTALFTLIVALVAAIPWVLYFAVHYVPGVAIPETISGVAGAVWIVALGYMLLTGNHAAKEK
jgi:hypothetical membrane protein